MLLVLVAHASAQGVAPELRWAPIVQVRQRLIFGLLPDEDWEGAVDQRARLGIDVSRSGVSARVSFQETRAWLTRRGPVSPGQFAPEIAEGWARVEGDLTRSVGAVATVGRQPLTLHQGRILGADDFSPGGQFFDAVRLEGHARPFSFEYVNARRFADDVEPFGLGVNVVRVGASAKNPVTTYEVDGIWLVDARNTDATTSTGGLWLRFDTGRWRGRAEGYIQVSEAGAASLYSGSAGWVFGPNERLLVHLRVDGLSGDDAGQVPWRPVLGDSHRFNGLLGQFANPDGLTDGLTDLHLVVESRPAPQLHAELEAHRYWSGAATGSELDGQFGWDFSPFASANGGIGAYITDAGATSSFGYLELDVHF